MLTWDKTVAAAAYVSGFGWFRFVLILLCGCAAAQLAKRLLRPLFNRLPEMTAQILRKCVTVLIWCFAAVQALHAVGVDVMSLLGAAGVAGIAIGSVWTAATTLLQFYATDVGLSAAVIWSFGDLGRATYKTDAIMLAVTALGLLVFTRLRWQCNALLSGDATARSMGVSVDRLRFLCLLLSSLITAVIVSFLGVIGFVGIICPHLVKKLLGEDHRITLPLSALSGSLLLLLSDTLSRSMGNGSALPVGAVTSLLGAPFFVGILLGRKGE